MGNERKHVGAIDYFCRLTHEMTERWWDFGSRARFDLPRQSRAPSPECKYAQNIYGISFYDSIAVIERKARCRNRCEFGESDWISEPLRAPISGRRLLLPVEEVSYADRGEQTPERDT